MDPNARYRGARTGRRGGAMVLVTFSVAVLGMLSFSMMMVSSASTQEARERRRGTASLYVAEAALSLSLQSYLAGEAASLGALDQPVAFGEASLRVEEVDLGSGLTSLVATGTDGLAETRLELVLHESSDPFFRWAAFGEEQLTMDSNARVDSYHSGLGDYASQEVNGSGSSAYANADGDVGSNGDVSLDTNATVWGDARPGPGHTTTVTGNAEVSGTTTPSPAVEDMAGFDVPTGLSAGDLAVPNGDTVSLAPGTHVYDALEVRGVLTVEGPATLVFDSVDIDSNAEILVDATGGPVDVYVWNDFVMDSNTLVASTTRRPADVRIHLNSDNILNPDVPVDLDEVDFDSNARFYGTIYAPRAAIEINSNFELFGALVARRVHLDSNARVHFDEALLEVEEGAETTFEAVCWRVVPHGYGAVPPAQ